MSRTLTVAAAQTGPVLADDINAEIEKAVTLVEEAGTKGVDIIGFCELFLTPFFPNRLEPDFANWFLELSDARLKPLLDAAKKHDMALVLPFGEKNNGRFYNSTAVIDERGSLVGIYRKIHIPAIFPSQLKGGTGSYEKFYFTPGDDLNVFDVKGAKIGIQICYDRKFPEGSRVLAAKGAEILFMPICAASYGETKLRDNTWDLPMRARAYENGAYVVAINRAGDEHGRMHLGQSMIISPVGAEILAIGDNENAQLLVSKIDLDAVRVARTSLPWWRDRRPDLYGALTKI